ncbi:hypothetical protein ABVK25_001511 [Lepraria finkii]|uniref:Major facilitator superfamily (MFS) profile domain-containing protein n=1 Tax=Lepraria finkii TaxID=1340010 RepID=A0ABR4BJ95_9LECA
MSRVSSVNMPAEAHLDGSFKNENIELENSVAPDTEKSSQDEDAISMEEDEYPRGFTFLLLTVGLMVVVLVLALDNYIIATAVPRLTTEFNDLNLIGWYGSSYFLTLMSFQPAFGQLCTIFPVKTVYLISIVVFEIGSAISASAPTSVAFIVGRLTSGAAGGGLWCGTLTLMGHAVPVSKRHLYVSVVTSMYGVASAAGPLLGGVFTDSPRLTWRFCFWLNLPIGFVAFVIIAVYLKPPRPTHLALSLTLKQKLARIDIAGAFLLIAAFVCLLIALQWGGTIYAWSNSKVWGCLLGFGLLIFAFIILQIRLKDRATIPLRIVSKRTAAVGCIFTTFMTMAIGLYVYYLPFYFNRFSARPPNSPESARSLIL